MAIDDVSFYNLLGEEITRSKIVEEMINYYKLKLEAGETRVTDFNEGSEIRNLLEAIAVDLYWLMDEENELTSIGFIESADGEWLDKHGENPFIRLARETGSEAIGYVTFSIPEALSNDVTIEEGTILVSDDGLEFATDGECTIFAGDTENTVSITCLTTGSDGNVEAGTITTIDDDYLDINGLTVTNEDPLTHGTDYEEDEEYRERLLSYIRQDDFGSLPYYMRLGESVEGVHDVLLVDEEVEEGETPEYTKIILVNGDVKPASSTVIANVLREFSIPDNIVVGHTFYPIPCEVDEIELTVNLTMQEVIDETIISNVLTTYFNGGIYDLYEFEGLYIDDKVTNEKLVDILTLIDEVIDVEIIYENETLTEIIPETNHALKLSALDINQTVET